MGNTTKLVAKKKKKIAKGQLNNNSHIKKKKADKYRKQHKHIGDG